MTIENKYHKMIRLVLCIISFISNILSKYVRHNEQYSFLEIVKLDRKSKIEILLTFVEYTDESRNHVYCHINWS